MPHGVSSFSGAGVVDDCGWRGAGAWVGSMRKTNLSRTRSPRQTVQRRDGGRGGGSSARRDISVLIADDHTFLREAMREVLSRSEGISVVAEADNGRQAIEMALGHKPRVAVVDIGMPRLNGLEAGRQIRKLVPETAVVVLTAHSNDHFLRQMADYDIQGYVLKDSPSELLVHAVREAALGKRFQSPAVSRRMKAIWDLDGGKRPVTLTSREIEVLQLIAEGAANKQVAAELNISIKTVEKHRQNLMDKLRIHETAGLTRYAITSGVVGTETQTMLPL
jgi:DNA-binding NarL/FixJ family response regulator